MAGFVYGQKENQRRRKAYEQEIEDYNKSQGHSNTAAGIIGGVGGVASAATGPIAGPIIAALTAIAAPLVAAYGAGDEPGVPTYLKEREIEVQPHQSRASRGNLQDPAGMSQGYEGQSGAQEPNDFRISALQGLKDKRRERNIGGLRR